MAVTYKSYFDKIPKIKYDINRSLINPKYETVTNIFFRVKYLEEALNNISAYFTVEVTDGDTPEILAEKVYGDAGANWMITMANKMIDPQWEWPLDYDSFQKYIAGKYGSVEAAMTTAHHYEMVVTRITQPDNIKIERRYIVNAEKLTDNNMTVPYNYYFPIVVVNDLLTDNTSITIDSSTYTVDSGAEDQDTGEFGLQPGSLAFAEYTNTYTFADGKTVTEDIIGQEINVYDYETQVNDSKRLIKIIKKEYYQQIMKEFEQLTDFRLPFERRVF